MIIIDVLNFDSKSRLLGDRCDSRHVLSGSCFFERLLKWRIIHSLKMSKK